jgi:hypothetical protein
VIDGIGKLVGVGLGVVGLGLITSKGLGFRV